MDKEKIAVLGCLYELRTPVTNIAGFGELLTHPEIGDLNEKQREYLWDILTSTQTLLAIVDDMQKLLVGEGERPALH